MAEKDIVLNEQYNLMVPAYEPRLLQKDWFAKTYNSIIREIDPALNILKRKRNCIQAGACFGIYPNYLALHFEKVYTFEPSPVLFSALDYNIKAENVVKICAALGENESKQELYIAKCGADSIVKYKEGQSFVIVAQTTIDSLNLEDVDFIMLDIECYEIEALKGARKTIKKYMPLIQVEMHDKMRGKLDLYLESIGYELKAKAGSKDEVWACKI